MGCVYPRVPWFYIQKHARQIRLVMLCFSKSVTKNSLRYWPKHAVLVKTWDGSWWFMNFCGGSWWFMIFHDISWWFVKICGDSWCFMVVHDDSWWFVMFRGGLWWFMMVRDVSWWFMLIHNGSWWFMMICDGFSLKFSRKYHVTHYLTNQSLRFSIKSHFEWDFMMVCDVVLCFVVVRDVSSWFVMCHYGSWCVVMVCDVSSWFVMCRHGSIHT